MFATPTKQENQHCFASEILKKIQNIDLSRISSSIQIGVLTSTIASSEKKPRYLYQICNWYKDFCARNCILDIRILSKNLIFARPLH